MKIQGAIFDCDGTILDSMPMWNTVFPFWLMSHGMPCAHELAARYEYMNFADECWFFHDVYGVSDSREAAFREVYDMVRHAYAYEVQPFCGVRAFLEELKAADIPMVIVSSTTTDLVREALTDHGLNEYFKDILYTGDIGADKNHPDVYWAARDVIGTPTDTTWVFEDAPFGVATAQAAGFPTVCLLNDHDGRDIDFMRAHCDILAHGYPELSIALLRDYERPWTQESEGSLQALIVGGSPDRSSLGLVVSLARSVDYIIACDRGAERLQEAGIVPDVFCGDNDSATSDTISWASSNAKTVIHYPTQKYVSDLTLCVDCARHEAARRHAKLHLTLTCTSGGRIDHALCVMGQLIKCADISPRLIEDIGGQRAECRVLAPLGTDTWELGDKPEGGKKDTIIRVTAMLSGAGTKDGIGATQSHYDQVVLSSSNDASNPLSNIVGRTFSAIALSSDTVVSEEGMHWNLDHAHLCALDDSGLSNIVESPHARIICHSGILACFLYDRTSTSRTSNRKLMN